MNKKVFLVIAAVAVMLVWSAAASAQTREQLPDAGRRPGPSALKAVPSDGRPAGKLSGQLKPSASMAASAESSFYGRTFYGALINSTEWADVSITQVPYGIYSFDTGGSPVMASHITDMGYGFTAGTYGRGTFVGVVPMSVMGALNGARYISIDTETWTEKKNVAHGTDKKSYSLLPSVMAYNTVDNTFYSLQYNDDLSGLDWCVYNPEYDEFDKIAAFRGRYNVVALAAMPDGGMYFINSYGDLYKIDRRTARPTFVGMTGITPVLYSQSMVFDGRTGMLLWAAQTAAGSQLYAVNPVTAEARWVLNFKNSEQFTAIWPEDAAAPDGAPAQAENLRLAYDADGGLQGTISFTVPSKTFGGQTLGGATLNVWLDGENIRSGKAVPGSAVQIPLTLTEGNHYVAVYLNNDAGYSPLSCVCQYAGYDVPVKVTSLTFTHDDKESRNNVSWTAPAGGVNGGYVDFANLTYTVVRMPDSVTVAKDIRQTTFTEAVPEDMRNYYYRVYAVNNGKMSGCAESNKIICGNAFTAPYSQSFADPAVFPEFFTVIDANGDGNTWRAGFSGDVRIDITDNNPEGDDWLLTPVLALEKDMTYRYTVNMKTFTNGYPEDFEVYVGTDPADLSAFRLVAKEEDFQLYETFGDYSADFVISETGKYFVALRYISKKEKNGSMMMLKNVKVTRIGSSKAPAAVSGLAVTPDADDGMAATVSFTTPGKNIEGSRITQISKVSVYRNGSSEPVHVFESPAVGTGLSWTDNGVSKVGVNTYTVVAENEHGEGEAVSDSAFVGIYAAPYLETFDTRAASELYKATMTGLDPVENPFYGWKYDENNKKMTCYAYLTDDEAKLELWLYTPMFRLDANSVYELGYKAKIDLTADNVTNKVYMGTAQEPEAQGVYVADMPSKTNYQLADVRHQVVTTEGGKFCFGFNTLAQGQYAYPNADLDDVSLTYLKPAASPYMFTGYEAAASPDGGLTADMRFNAPAVNYHGERLTENLKVEIFRGQSPTPVFSREDVVPGTEITWTDTQAQHGNNVYMLVASNSYGRSEVLTDTLFVGRDVPTVVSDYKVRGSADNQDAVITWEAPAQGVNGGVIVPSEISYNVYKYNPDENLLTPIEKNVKGTSYTVENEPSDGQELLYYAVSAVTAEGESQATAASVVLGRLYTLPFKESFAGRELSTEPWQLVDCVPPYITWDLTNPTGDGYNNATPQDGDGGVAYMFNGSMYESVAGAGFVSPKFTVGGEDAVLRFWVYNIATAYPDNKPYVTVMLRADDGMYEEEATFVVGSDTEDGWKQYEIPLGRYKVSSHVSIAFYGVTAGGNDVIYLDNIVIEKGYPTSIDGVKADGRTVSGVKYYDTMGREVGSPQKGVTIRTVRHTDGSSETTKVVVK